MNQNQDVTTVEKQATGKSTQKVASKAAKPVEQMSKQDQDQKRKEERDKRDENKRRRHAEKIRKVTENMSTEVIVTNTHESLALANIASQTDLAIAQVRKMMGLGSLDFMKAATALTEAQNLMIELHEHTKRLCKLASINYRTPWLVKNLLEAREKQAKADERAKIVEAKAVSTGVTATVEGNDTIHEEAEEQDLSVANG